MRVGMQAEERERQRREPDGGGEDECGGGLVLGTVVEVEARGTAAGQEAAGAPAGAGRRLVGGGVGKGVGQLGVLKLQRAAGRAHARGQQPAPRCPGGVARGRWARRLPACAPSGGAERAGETRQPRCGGGGGVPRVTRHASPISSPDWPATGPSCSIRGLCTPQLSYWELAACWLHRPGQPMPPVAQAALVLMDDGLIPSDSRARTRIRVPCRQHPPLSAQPDAPIRCCRRGERPSSHPFPACRVSGPLGGLIPAVVSRRASF